MEIAKSTETTAADQVAAETQENQKVDIAGALIAATRSPAFIPGVVMLVGIALIFMPLWKELYDMFNSEDGYYSHGWIVPLISGYIIYRWWPKMKDTPVKPFWLAAVPLAAILWVTKLAVHNNIYGLMGLCLMLVLGLCVWLAAGFRWAMWMAAPIAYLSFMLPLFNEQLNNATNPLQLISTKVAYELLRICGFQVYMDDLTIIYMNQFVLNVEVPCSGLKLVIALTAFTFLFVLIGRLHWVANLVMIALILPLAVMINGLRIALIGVVGDTMGHDAGMKFHDYSGYITLLVCFFVLFKIARLLGWKD